MNETPDNLPTRRQFLKNAGYFTAASALAGVALPPVHAAENNTLSIALVGCGGRGTGAAGNALDVKNKGPITLAAMADVFDKRLNTSYQTRSEEHTSELQSRFDLVCRLLLEKKKKKKKKQTTKKLKEKK